MTGTAVSALRYNNGKLRMSLVPPSLPRYTAAALTYGAQKYAPDNWRNGFNWNDIMDSLERHLADFKEGVEFDVESGLPMLSHIACNVAFLIEHYDLGLGRDDRWVPPEGGLRKVLRFNPPPAPPKPAKRREKRKVVVKRRRAA